jgi:CRP/FNR family transcriptional regulator, cyclic AMP receptor protein
MRQGKDNEGAMRSTRPDRLKLLSEVDVLEPLSAGQLDRVFQRTVERTFRGGESVYLPGDASEMVFLLLAGRVRLYGMVRERELTFDIIRAGSMFGEASLTERTQNEYAQALEPSRVGLLELNTFWQLVRENSEFNTRVIKVLSERSRTTRGRMTDIALKEVSARLAALILDLVQDEGVVTREGHYLVSTRYTHEQLGSMIGVKRVAVTRAFGALQDNGCVQLRRRQIYVVDLTALKGLAVGG